MGLLKIDTSLFVPPKINDNRFSKDKLLLPPDILDKDARVCLDYAAALADEEAGVAA